MLTIPLLALAVATVTITLARAKVTAPLRAQLSRIEFIKEMLGCLYCTSHWVSAGFVALTRPHVLDLDSRWAEWIVLTFALVALSAPIMWVVGRAHQGFRWGSDGHPAAAPTGFPGRSNRAA